jgi:hypothetical protein
MITAEGYQPLITQLYFQGDKHLSEDSSSSSPTAKRRILKVERLKDNTAKVTFDISLSPNLKPEISAIDKLTGIYTFENAEKLEFFKKDKALWMKNEVYGVDMKYVGDNTFKSADADEAESYRFEVMQDGIVKLHFIQIGARGEKTIRSATKSKS